MLRCLLRFSELSVVVLCDIGSFCSLLLAAVCDARVGDCRLFAFSRFVRDPSGSAVRRLFSVMNNDQILMLNLVVGCHVHGIESLKFLRVAYLGDFKRFLAVNHVSLCFF